MWNPYPLEADNHDRWWNTGCAWAPCCIELVSALSPLLFLSDGSDTPTYVLTSLLLAAITFGAGGVAFWHANQSLKGKPSRPLKLPSLLLFLDIFGVLLIIGLFVTYGDLLPGLLIPPLLYPGSGVAPVGHNIVVHSAHTFSCLN